MLQSPLTKCLSPVRIKNKATGELMFVPCNHCVNCNHNKSVRWTERLNFEAKASARVLFLTLTYDNDHIPRLVDDGSGYLISQTKGIEDVNLSDFPHLHFPNVQLPYLVQNGRHDHDYEIGINSKYDAQNFIKRIRRHVEFHAPTLFPHLSKDRLSVRYLLVSEYGPDTFRPHLHGLLFFQSSEVAEFVRQYIKPDIRRYNEHYAWELCSMQRIDCSYVFGNAASYVAKYINRDTSLPPLLQIEPFRTFKLFSKNPALGCTDFIKHDCSVILEKRCITYTKTTSSSTSGAATIQLPYPVQLLRYWFPQSFKCSSFTREGLLRILNSSCSFLPSDLMSSVDCSRELISSYLPNLVSKVKHDYGLFIPCADGKLRRGMHRTFSDVAHLLSDKEFWFGVPSSRMFIIRALLYISKFHISVLDYVNTYFDLVNLIKSESFHRQVEYENNLDITVSGMTKFCLLFPSFILGLPKAIYEFDLFTEAAYADYLRLFDLRISDFYDSRGCIQSRFTFENLRVFHNSFVDNQIYNDKVATLMFKFDKIRKVNSRFKSNY